MSRIHPQNLSCGYCKVEKENWEDMNDHLKIHNCKSQQCNICEINVYSPNLMKIHVKDCHNDFRYKCNKCSSFLCKTKIELSEHSKTHRKVK